MIGTVNELRQCLSYPCISTVLAEQPASLSLSNFDGDPVAECRRKPTKSTNFCCRQCIALDSVGHVGAGSWTSGSEPARRHGGGDVCRHLETPLKRKSRTWAARGTTTTHQYVPGSLDRAYHMIVHEHRYQNQVKRHSERLTTLVPFKELLRMLCAIWRSVGNNPAWMYRAGL